MTRTRSWLAANRWYLLALVILIPGAILAAMSSDWFRYEAQERGEPLPAVAATSVDYAQGTWKLLEWHSFAASTQAGQNAGLLAGTELVTATIAIEPPSTGFFCQTALIAADGREWQEASFSDADFDIAGDAEAYCLSDMIEPYKLQVFYVVPEGASEGATLEVSVGSESPRFIAFAL